MFLKNFTFILFILCCPRLLAGTPELLASIKTQSLLKKKIAILESFQKDATKEREMINNDPQRNTREDLAQFEKLIVVKNAALKIIDLSKTISSCSEMQIAFQDFYNPHGEAFEDPALKDFYEIAGLVCSQK